MRFSFAVTLNMRHGSQDTFQLDSIRIQLDLVVECLYVGSVRTMLVK